MSENNHVEKLKPYEQVSLNRTVIKVGAKWCRACKDSKESYEEIANQHGRITFYEIDSDRFIKEKSMMKEINNIVKKTSALPTFYFFRKNKLIGEVEGFKRSKIESYVDRLE